MYGTMFSDFDILINQIEANKNSLYNNLEYI